MKKILICLLCLTMLLAGCNGTGGDETEPSTDAVTQTPTGIEDGRLYIADGGEALFKLCYTDLVNADAAEHFQKIFKTKTGIQMDIVKNIDDLNGSKAIFVGVIKNDENSFRIAGENISYDGYGSVYEDGNIYLCGFNSATIYKAAQSLVSQITNKHIDKNAEGGTKVFIESEMLFVSNPDYQIEDAKLLGKGLFEYALTITAEDKYLDEVAVIAQDAIGSATGAYLPIVTDGDGYDCRINIVEDTAMDITAYSMKSNGTHLEVRVGGKIALIAAFNDIQLLSVTDTSAGISVERNAKDTFLADNCAAREAGTTLRVMSANVLGSGQEKEDFQCRTAVRSEIMAEYILAFEPDSVGLQEYYGEHSRHLAVDISSKYSMVNFGSYGAPMVGTIYLKDKYTLVESKIVVITLESSSVPNYLTWVALKDKTTGEIYIHGNLHLDYRADNYRLEQAPVVNAELKRVKEKYPDAVIAVTGDYNCKQGSSVLTTIKDGLPIEDAVLSAPTGKADNTLASFHTLCEKGSINVGWAAALDHVFVSTDTASVLRHKIIHDSLIYHASDHYPVVVDIAKK